MKGAIGYVEFAYAKKNAMAYAQLKNKDGQFVLPTADSFMSAAAGADWGKTPGFGVVVTDQPGKTSWPITGATFVIMHKHQDNPQRAKDVLQFFDWAYNNGAKMATELDYIPMPRATVGLIENEWKKQIKDAAAKAIWP